MRPPPLVLTGEQRQQMMDLIRRPTTAQRMVERALIVLAAADGKGYRAIAQEHRLSRNTVGKWGRRFAIQGLAGLADLARPGQPRRITARLRASRLTLIDFSRPTGSGHR